MLDCVELSTGPNPTHSVIWLHGLGADGHDFEPIVPELVRPNWPALRFVFPHAPIRPVTINGGMQMRAWYDITSLDFNLPREDAAGVEASCAEVEQLIARENARGIPSSRILLAGFSQGGAITLALGLRRAESLAGLIALSTYVPMAEQTLAQLSEAGRAMPIFMAHGSQDPVIPCTIGERSAQRLRNAGLDLQWRQYPMQHAVCLEEIRDLAQWMEQRVLGA
ncbi:alpha/beta hydrolase [Pseudomarimonas arenosa]|uniref:Alpha/beta hydrolase n=1 Tax=Pseudomarimonas arenosa TaxID=2774145 RepID=A0AAW3ZH04_9GAMM|nr:alpha/beta hydrolase [Pseudomarimonas arenosa]MBD8524267.1 alpha/beta hydrolase [Pseudomarimonas arenosa]